MDVTEAMDDMEETDMIDALRSSLRPVYDGTYTCMSEGMLRIFHAVHIYVCIIQTFSLCCFMTGYVLHLAKNLQPTTYVVGTQ